MADSSTSDHPVAARTHSASERYSRRSICRGVAVLSLPLAAGCSTISGMLGGDPGEVTVFNDTGSAVTATITVTDLSAETTVVSETTDVDSSQAAKFDDVFASATRYRFEAETSDGPSNSHEWELPSTDHYLYVTIGSNSIEFEENGP